jgi:hypothetical protein
VRNAGARRRYVAVIQGGEGARGRSPPQEQATPPPIIDEGVLVDAATGAPLTGSNDMRARRDFHQRPRRSVVNRAGRSAARCSGL